MAKEMNFLNIGNNKFEIADAISRNSVINLNGGFSALLNHTFGDVQQIDDWYYAMTASGSFVAWCNKHITFSDWVDFTTYDSQAGERNTNIVALHHSPNIAVQFPIELSEDANTRIFASTNQQGSYLTVSKEVNIENSSFNVSCTTAVGNTTAAFDADFLVIGTTGISSSSDLDPTTYDEELVDVRVGYDGTIYQTAGDAVRSQIEQAMSSGSGSGLTNDIKEALLNCFAHVAWTDEHGQDYVDALEAALYARYTVTNNLTDVTTSNNATEVTDGDSYTATLTADEGYITHIVVTMNGVDITNSVFTPNS